MEPQITTHSHRRGKENLSRENPARANAVLGNQPHALTPDLTCSKNLQVENRRRFEVTPLCAVRRFIPRFCSPC